MKHRTPGSIGQRLLQIAMLYLVAISSLNFSASEAKAAEKQNWEQGNGISTKFEFGSESRLKYLKATLGIKRGQSKPWAEYALALQAFRKAVRDRREEEVQRIFGNPGLFPMADDSRFRERQEQYDLAKADLRAKYDTLYAVLDASQRLLADATLTRGECGR